MVPAKTFSKLFVLGRIQGVAGHDDIGLTLVTIGPETVAAADDEGDNTEDLQIEQEYGGVHPAVGEVFQFGVFQLDWLV